MLYKSNKIVIKLIRSKILHWIKK